MWTIQTYDEDASASQRLEAWQTAINVGNSRPLGLGFAMYNAVTAGIYAPPGVTFIRAAHSIYFQVLGEHGYVGLVLFVLIWWLTFRVAAQLRREARNRPEVAWVYTLAGMCQVSLVAYLVGGAFLSLAYFDMPYNVMVILVVTQRWLRENSKNDALAAASLSRAAVQPNTTQQALP